MDTQRTHPPYSASTAVVGDQIPTGRASGTRNPQFARDALYAAFRPTRTNVAYWILWVVALGGELALLALLRGGDVYAWEVSLTRTLQDVPASQQIFRVTSTLTDTLSVPFALLFIAILAGVWAYHDRLTVFLLGLSFPLHVLAQFPKALIDRPRPPAGFADIEGVGGFQSFPSGHSEYVITFCGFLALLVCSRLPERWQQAVTLGVWGVFALATGFGRIAAGRHWPLDVLTSFLVGFGLLSGLLWLNSALRAPTRH